jgi:hypothetical protein
MHRHMMSCRIVYDMRAAPLHECLRLFWTEFNGKAKEYILRWLLGHCAYKGTARITSSPKSCHAFRVKDKVATGN